MASSGWKLYTNSGNPRAQKALIVAQYGDFQLETPEFAFGKDNKSKEYLAKFPLGKVPALETPEGNITESNAIARTVARKVASKHNLLGRTDIEKAQVDQWIDFAVSELELPIAAWVYPIFGVIPHHKEAVEQAKVDLKKNLTLLQNFLNTRTFLVGERITLADIVVAMTLKLAFVNVFEPAFRKPYGNVLRWFSTVMNQPQVHKVVGSVPLCQKAGAPNSQSLTGAAAQPNKAQAAKSEPKKEEAKKADDVDDLFGESDEPEDAAPAKPKEEAKPKPPKQRAVEKSNVILDCKPIELETDMALMEEKVRAIQMDGLFWGPSKLVEVAYGIKKLQITCVIEDEKVFMDDLEEKVAEAGQDLIQSIDVASMVRAG